MHKYCTVHELYIQVITLHTPRWLNGGLPTPSSQNLKWGKWERHSRTWMQCSASEMDASLASCPDLHFRRWKLRVWESGNKTYVYLVHSATICPLLVPLKLLGESFCVLVTFDEQVSFLAGRFTIAIFYTPRCKLKDPRNVIYFTGHRKN